MLGPILVRIGHDHASRSPGYPWALLQAVVDLQAVVNVADLHERRSCRVSAAFAVLRHKVSHVLADPPADGGGLVLAETAHRPAHRTASRQQQPARRRSWIPLAAASGPGRAKDLRPQFSGTSLPVPGEK